MYTQSLTDVDLEVEVSEDTFSGLFQLKLSKTIQMLPPLW